MTRLTRLTPVLALGFATVLSWQPPSAHAWSKHRLLMPYVVDSLGDFERKRLAEPATAPCPDEDQDIYASLAQTLGLNGAITLPPSSASPCPAPREKKAGAVSPAARRPDELPLALLRIGDWADDPDRGMDQNLPDSLDPAGERRYMGGTQGPTSQGFRHMYFGGWRVLAPIASFQIPMSAIGQSPERVELLAQEAKRLWIAPRESETVTRDPIWSARLLAWAMHFLQDLAQPFHAVQIPHLSMVPWSSLWPPGGSFKLLVIESTRTIGNYHYAYEQWTAQTLLSPHSPLDSCLRDPSKRATLSWSPSGGSPRELARIVARESVRLGPVLGRAQLAFFGHGLKAPGVDLPREQGSPDYASLDSNPQLTQARQALIEVSCRALAHAIEASRLITTWLIQSH